MKEGSVPLLVVFCSYMFFSKSESPTMCLNRLCVRAVRVCVSLTTISHLVSVFGISLADVLAREQPLDGIPLICHRLVGYLRANGLDKEGVFRVPGRQQLVGTIALTNARLYTDMHTEAKVHAQFSPKILIAAFDHSCFELNSLNPLRAQVERLRDEFDKGNVGALESTPDLGAHDVASLLKLWCRVSRPKPSDAWCCTGVRWSLAPAFIGIDLCVRGQVRVRVALTCALCPFAGAFGAAVHVRLLREAFA